MVWIEIIPGWYVEARFENYEMEERETRLEAVAIFQMKDCENLNQSRESREEVEWEDWKTILKVEWQDLMIE